jgi:predicted Zn-dependent peptidase
MEKHVLSNGLNVIVERRRGATAVVEVSVKAGSADEGKDVAGASHFLEHMLFEGTKKRPTSREITNAVEKLGGILFAGTDTERTVYACKVLRKDVGVALDVLSDMLANPLFDEDAFERQRKVILSEIALDKDDPKEHMWTLLQERLFPGHPYGRPSYGSEESVAGLSMGDVRGFFEKFYRAGNMTVAVVGDVPDALKKVRGYFGGFAGGSSSGGTRDSIRPLKQKTLVEERENILQSYSGVGFRAYPRTSRKSYCFDEIDAILGRGQSGRIFDEVRNKRGLAYDAGVEYESSFGFGMFYVYACTEREDEEATRKVIWKELEKLNELSEEDVSEAKTFVAGRYLMRNDEPMSWADNLCFALEAGDVRKAVDYPDAVASVTLDEVVSTAEKSLHKNASCRVTVREKMHL